MSIDERIIKLVESHNYEYRRAEFRSVAREVRVAMRNMEDRIKRLEEAGPDAIREAAFDRENDAWEIWNKAMETK